MRIRPATLKDAPDLARVHVASWRVAYRGIIPDAILDELSVEAFETRWRQSLEQAQRSTLVGEIGQRVVGLASVGASRDADAVPLHTRELYALYLDPTVWGQGMGYVLWSAALQKLLADEFAEATLWVLEANSRARTFYERVGFHLEPGVTKALEREGAVLPEVRYRRLLD